MAARTKLKENEQIIVEHEVQILFVSSFDRVERSMKWKIFENFQAMFYIVEL